MRLIDSDELKKVIAKETYNFEQIPIRVDKVQEIIDNAPTVEYPFYQEAYQTGYEEGKNERPQVNVIPQECMKVLAEAVVDVVQQIDWKALCEKVEERPHGEWIDRIADKGYVECPFCHKQITGGDLNFCVKCGADMRKGDES